MIIKDSFSGTKFKLFEKKNNIFLKKKFKKINVRDKESFIKQKKFDKYIINSYSIESAKIENINISKNFIVLKYYDGLSGSDLILNGDLSVHKILDVFLSEYLKTIIKNSSFIKFNKKLYTEKCRDIQTKIPKRYLKNYNKLFNKIFFKLHKIKFNVVGNCHGDLTLSNIIVDKKKNKIVLIDFLKTYWDSPIQDICKLIQDLRLYWTARKLSKNDQTRAKIFCENLNPFQIIKDRSFEDIIELEMLMTIARIIPYVPLNDNNTYNWIDKSYKKIDKSFIRKL